VPTAQPLHGVRRRGLRHRYTYYIDNDWLSQFSYRIALNPWIFAAAGAACFLISLLTVVIQSWRAASENPINNIKTE